MEQIDEQMRDAVARELRKVYVAKKSALLKRPWKPNARHQAFAYWQHAADQVLRLNANPEAYIQAAFTYCRMTTGPFPNMLAGPGAAGWWKQFVHQNPRYKEEVERLAEQGITDVFSHMQPTIIDIQEDLQHVRQSLYDMTKELPDSPLGPKNLDIVRSEVLLMKPHIRLMLTYPDEYIRKYYGKEILDFLETRPEVVRALQTLGYDMNEILIWLRQT